MEKGWTVLTSGTPVVSYDFQRLCWKLIYHLHDIIEQTRVAVFIRQEGSLDFLAGRRSQQTSEITSISSGQIIKSININQKASDISV
ncbi:hypothetical protein OUZ56_004661 [Daphnia magna]|uniref:Uncharacterized protein n=1 Tax=Daphnia magna TaxID=35525 RepID=A0ABQ9YQH0_9CRUS|nr:hypothetical protein OUZ56_004661 [Daphnia magna]